MRNPAPAAPAPVEPLTGLPLGDPALLSKVALVVKVSNDGGARPQTGLNDPDIIFEVWGAGPTRFATIWHSRDLDFVVLADALSGDRTLDASGCVVAPGLVDLHSHLRQPGAEAGQALWFCWWTWRSTASSPRWPS